MPITAKDIAERIQQNGKHEHILEDLCEIVESTHVVEAVNALDEFLQKWESDFFQLSSRAEDGQVLADWIQKATMTVKLVKDGQR